MRIRLGDAGDVGDWGKSPYSIPSRSPPVPSHPVRFFRRRAAQPAMIFCGARVRARAPAGTSFVMVEPGADVGAVAYGHGGDELAVAADEGAAPIAVRCFFSPS